MQEMTEPPTIEHNPHERREPKWLWKAGFAMIALFWLLQWREGFDWDQIMLGLGTGAAIAGWAMDMTGGEVPESWRKAARRR